MTPRRPERGEIWRVEFNPTRGAEIQKRRPAVAISSDALWNWSVGRMPLSFGR
ncbi:MAG: type II toxin-antitoxin system PemK/MazF family toxin [Verrucomicrobia bacterium]|nr:MAG: type II toxin-antitoxin system PemK/MazF family toxin [Verrucomicrobiota bacterium]PYJ97409.1 MAG: type II toxin-antitoxin system PemK/MazF family toxin [Verrucomicrobiota bacterium]